jgi:hypothetical protein
MPRSRIASLCGALLLCVMLAACRGPVETRPQAEPASVVAEVRIERHRDQRKLPESLERLVIDNPFGEIQIRQTQTWSLAYHANEQRIGTSPRVASIDWAESEDGVELRVRYPEQDPALPPDPRLGRVDLAVFVPAGPRVVLRSDFGGITVRRVRNAVDAESRSGRIVVAARDAMQLRSVSGELRAFPMQGGWSRPLVLETGGNVVADVPLFAGLALEARSRRGIRADFALDGNSEGDDGTWTAVLRRDEGELQMRIDAGGHVDLMGLRQPLP